MHLHYSTITQWLSIHPHWGWLSAFIISFAESVAIIGSIVPGSVTMTAIGILAGSGVLSLWHIILFAILGAIAGDGLSFLLGYYYADNISNIWPFKRHPKILTKGRGFFAQHGGKSIFIGRFVGPVRALIPIIAGTLKMAPRRYYAISICSAILWAPMYMLPGVLLGAASLEMSPKVAAELIIFVLAVLFIFWLLVQLTKFIYHTTHNYFIDLLNAKWQIWRTQPSKKLFCYLLKHAGRPEERGQLLLAACTTIAAIIFLTIYIAALCHASIIIRANEIVYHLARSVYTVTLSKIMVCVTSFGNKNVLAPFAIAILIWLLLRKQWRTATHWFAGIFLSLGAIFTFKHLFFSARPTGIVQQHLTSSLPSGHTTLSIAVYGLLTFFLSRQLSANMRKYLYRFTMIFCASIGVSRIYLSAHWLSDVLAGIFLALTILGVVIISSLRLRTEKIHLKSLAIFISCVMSVTYGWHIYHHYASDLHNYRPIWPSKKVAMQAWWQQKSKDIPQYRLDRLGHPVAIFNVQWAGNLADIKRTLLQHGWVNVYTRDYLSTLKSVVQEQKPIHHKPLLPELFNDQPPAAELIKERKNLPSLILRLWNPRIALMPQKINLWVGTIEYDSKQEHLLSFHAKKLAGNAQIKKYILRYIDRNWQSKKLKVKNVPKKLVKKIHFANALLLKPSP
jgi:membrane protein DedA with SNARE-associated domain/membrane-associated phospholipid phosphatase